MRRRTLADEPTHLLRVGDLVLDERGRTVEVLAIDEPYVRIRLLRSAHGQPIPQIPAMRPERTRGRWALRRRG